MKKRFKVLLLGLILASVCVLIAPVVPGPVSSPSCYQNGVAGYVTQTQFQKDGSTWITVCDSAAVAVYDPQHCVQALVTSSLVNNPCIEPPRDGVQLPGSVKRAAYLRSRECGQ